MPKEFIGMVKETNDVAERSIAIVKEFSGNKRNEAWFQWPFQAVGRHRRRSSSYTLTKGSLDSH